jgi:hypothetical protein
MKGKLALLILVAVAVAVLWLLSERVEKTAAENESFIVLYEAAKSAWAGKSVYAKPGPAVAPKYAPQPAAPEEAETEPTETEPAVLTEDPSPTVEVAEEPAAGEGGLPAVETGASGFKYLPYVGLLLAPLSLFESVRSAALGLYWFNVGLAVFVLLVSVHLVAGKIAGAGRGMALIPLIAAAPLLLYFLPSASLTVLALAFVLVALCLFRNKYDIAAGAVSAVAIFSPIGIAIGAYWFLKRSWKAVLAFLVVATLLIAIVPTIALGPAGALKELQAFRHETIRPYIRITAETTTYESIENQSLWAVMMRHTVPFTRVGEYAGEQFQSTFSVDITRWTKDYMGAVLGVAGIFFLVASVVGAWRKLLERQTTIVGLEGALIVLAALILSPTTGVDSMAALLFPLAAAVYVVSNTELRRVSHHANYMALVLAAASFYVSLHPQFLALGIGCAGMVALWVGVLAGVYCFRPHLVRGTLSAALKKRQAEAEKPVDLVEVHTDAERQDKQGKGVLPLPGFSKRKVEGRPMTPREDREIPDFEELKPEEEEEEPEETDSPF